MDIREQKNVILKYLVDNFKPGDIVSIRRDQTPSDIDESIVDDHIRTFVELGLVRYSKDQRGKDITGTSSSIMCVMKSAAFEFWDKGGFLAAKVDSVGGHTITNQYIFNGHNSRVNNDNATDNSTNTVNESNFSFLEDMISAIRETGDENKELLEKAIKLQESAGTGLFKSAYADFISLAANHMSLLSPFWPQISGLIHSIGS